MDSIWVEILANPASSYNTGRSRWQDIYDMVALLADGRVLDVGCGLGHLTATLKVPVMGIDISSVAIEEAKRRHPHGAFATEDIEKSDRIERGNYDLVCFTQVLEHIAEDQALVKRIPTGKKVFISVPTEKPRESESADHVNFFKDISALRARYEQFINIQYIGEVSRFRFLCLYGTRI